MNDTRLAIFDDDVGRWGPLTRLRPIFSQRTGMLTTHRRIERHLNAAATALSVPEWLAPVTAARHPQCRVNEPLPGGDWLVVNGRWLALEAAEQVAALEKGQALYDEAGHVIAARLDAAQARDFLTTGYHTLPTQVAAKEASISLITRPWHVLDHLPAALEADLAATDLPAVDPHALPGVTAFGGHPLHLGENARLDPGAIVNLENGPVVIQRGSHLQPGAVIEGPVAIGRDNQIAPHAVVRANTATGPVCKIGGEVSGSIIQAYTNKAHIGFLGDTLVGAWCNFGASTVVSNLKNTYNHVRIALDPDTEAEDTGRRHQGPIVGDLVRTAIGTRLTTGAVIDTANMLAMSRFAPKHAPPLGFYTDAGRSEHEVEKLIETAQAMMQRRNVTMLDAEADLLRSLSSS